MAHHRRGRAKNQRAGCLMCKPQKVNGADRANVGGPRLGPMMAERRARLDDDPAGWEDDADIFWDANISDEDEAALLKWLKGET